MGNASFKGYDSIFAVRLRDLIYEKAISKQTLSEEIGVSRQAISQYCDGSTIPNADKLTEIAKYFNVSTDYLVGITDHPVSVDTEDGEIIRTVCDYTGLSEKSIETLHLSSKVIFKNILKTVYEDFGLSYEDTSPSGLGNICFSFQDFLNPILSSDFMSDENKLFRNLYALKDDIGFFMLSFNNKSNDSDKELSDEWKEFHNFDREIKAVRFELSELFNSLVLKYISKEYKDFKEKYDEINYNLFLEVNNNGNSEAE